MSAATPTRARRILLVDDNVEFTALFREFLLAQNSTAWEVHTAAIYNEALALLKQHSFDLVTLDLQMPVMDGMQFLTLLKRSYPALQVVVLTGFATPENRSYCLQGGAALFFDKTELTKGFDNIYAALESLALTPTEGFRGVLRQVGLSDVLQMECLGAKSSILEISGASAAGKIYIQDGAVVHAECGAQFGEPALFKLLGLKGGEFHLKPFAKPSKHTIDGNWESLLMEAARLADEASANATEEPPPAVASVPPDAPVEAAPPEIPAVDLVESEPDVQIYEPPPLPEDPMLQAERFLEEVLLVSGGGEVLYEWQSPSVDGRLRLIELLANKSGSFGRTLSLGEVDRLVVETPESRLVALLHADRKLLVRIGIRWSAPA